MAASFDKIANLGANRECIRLNVRIIRLWSVPMYNNPKQTGSLEMVLMDEYGGKIQASVRKPLLNRFSGVLEEGCVYKMVYFNVVPNSGHYRASLHEFKLVFLFKTAVVRKECESIPKFGLSFVPFAEILGFDDSYEHLIDVMGVLTTILPERKYEKDGKVTPMVVMELTDPTGKLECTLFGDYVEELRSYLHGGDNVQVIVVVQLARVKIFKGKTVIQNSMNATRLLFNPDIPEAISFRNSIAEHGVIDVEPLAVVLDDSREGLECDFMKLHPKKSLCELSELTEGGMYVVLATIVAILNDGSWFYLACKCNKSVSLQSNVYFCESCQVPVLQVSPRFKVKVEVSDEMDTAAFVLFDRDMNQLISKSCEEMLTESMQDVVGCGYPPVLENLVGRRMLFKVEKKSEEAEHFGGSYAVRRTCVDEDIIAMFDLPGADLTPVKATFAPPFPSLSTDIDELEGCFTQSASDVLCATVSLGDDHFGGEISCTPAKRKLNGEFVSSAIVDLVSSDQSDDPVDAEDEVAPLYKLLPVKIEKN